MQTRSGVRAEIWIFSFFNLGACWGRESTPHPDRFTNGKVYQYPSERCWGPSGLRILA